MIKLSLSHDFEQIFMQSVLFVCLGNICRSPTAHAVFNYKVQQNKLNIVVDSAGTSGFHQGQQPDIRSVQAGEYRGYDFSGIYSRPVLNEDFERFDFIFAMDKENLNELLRRAPLDAQNKIKLFLDFAEHFEENEVPDPYYGGEQGFELVLDLIEDACDGFIKQL